MDKILNTTTRDDISNICDYVLVFTFSCIICATTSNSFYREFLILLLLMLPLINLLVHRINKFTSIPFGFVMSKIISTISNDYDIIWITINMNLTLTLIITKICIQSFPNKKFITFGYIFLHILLSIIGFMIYNAFIGEHLSLIIRTWLRVSLLSLIIYTKFIYHYRV